MKEEYLMSEHNGSSPATKTYNPREHLIKIRTKEGLKDYYPANWRLYELGLRYPPANFSSEIIWKRTSAHSDAKRYASVHDVLLYYSKSDARTWNPQHVFT